MLWTSTIVSRERLKERAKDRELELLNHKSEERKLRAKMSDNSVTVKPLDLVKNLSLVPSFVEIDPGDSFRKFKKRAIHFKWNGPASCKRS